MEIKTILNMERATPQQIKEEQDALRRPEDVSKFHKILQEMIKKEEITDSNQIKEIEKSINKLDILNKNEEIKRKEIINKIQNNLKIEKEKNMVNYNKFKDAYKSNLKMALDVLKSSVHNTELWPQKKLNDEELIRAIRSSVMAEHDATQLYTQIADSTDNPLAQQVLRSVANEEIVHVGEFNQLLKTLDPNEEELYEEGEDEVIEIEEQI